MADDFKVTVSAQERLWLRKSVEYLRESLVRSVKKEMEGSEIYCLRWKEINSLNVLLGRLQ